MSPPTADGRRKRTAPQNIEVVKQTVFKKHYRTSPSIAHQSEAGSIRNVSDYSDTERFARTAALMAMLGDEINDYGSAIQSELQKRMEQRKYHDVSETVKGHLDNFTWPTPPVSTALTSAKTPSSASSETRRSRFIERELQNKEFQFLLEHDHEFHSLMSDLDGLREWWASNRAAWRLRRDRIHEVDNFLKELAFRMDNVDGQEHRRLQWQFKRQRDYMSELLDWFPQNERLQKKVKTQFKIIARKAAKLEGRISPLRIVKAWEPAGGFEFKIDEHAAHVTELPWWHGYGFAWWLASIGADHLQYCLDRSKAQLESSRTRLEECEVTIVMTKAETECIEEGAPEDDDLLEREIKEFSINIQRAG
jgi:hypothetical protein